MTYYLNKVGRAGARLMSSCKDLYNDVNAAYLTGATDVIVVRQKDGTLKSTPFHVRFGKLGVLRTGDLKEVEIEVNGKLMDLTMNIDETGKVFFRPSKYPEGNLSSDSDREQVAIVMEGESSSKDEQQYLHGTESMPSISQHNGDTKMMDVGTLANQDYSTKPTGLLPHSSDPVIPVPELNSHSIEPSLSLPVATPPILIQSASSSRTEAMFSSSMPDRLEVMSDSGIETRRRGVVVEDDDDECVQFSALSDTEVELRDCRSNNSYWDKSSNSVKASVGEVTSSSAQTDVSEEDRHKPHKDRSSADSVDRPGFWGALTGMLKMRQYKRIVSQEDGIYLDDIDTERMDPDELSKFFPDSVPSSEMPGPSSGGVEVSQVVGSDVGGAHSSGVGSSPAQSLSPSTSVTDLHQPTSHAHLKHLIDTLSGVSFSLCGGLSLGIVTEDIFQSSVVPFPDFCADPLSILSHPDLVVMVDGKYYNWQVAAPIIMSAIVYLQVLPQRTKDKIIKDTEPKKSRQSFWNFWGRGQKDNLETERAKSEGASPSSSPRKWKEVESSRCRNDSENESKIGDELTGIKNGDIKDDDLGLMPLRRVTEEGVVSSDDEVGVVRNIRPRQRSLKRKKIDFTNCLTSEQLEGLCLEPGPNKVQFSITTKYQGTAKASCTVYLWDYHDKIVVSDIDGTITRSDVAGQVLPFLGMDWTQNGVVELFSAISKNGYKIAYLSARAIGQAGYTKEFLRKVRRGSSCLPDGPLFLFPFSLYTAFRKEVIERRPEEFKIHCLKQIRGIFPAEFSPLHAGFGNRHTDVKSYTNVGIPESRIFTVNHKGILKHKSSVTFQSSYTYLVGLVDRQFPPLRPSRGHVSHSNSICENEEMKEEYSNFNYWRMPVPDVDLPDLP